MLEGLGSPGLFSIRDTAGRRSCVLGWGSLHSKVIRSSVGENVLNFHLCAQRVRWARARARKEGCSRSQSGDCPEGWLCNCRDLASSGRRVSNSWSPGRGQWTHPADWAVLPSPSPTLLAPSRGFLAQEACLSSKKLPPAGSSQLGCISKMAPPPAPQFGQGPHTGRGRTAVFRKHRGNQGPRLISRLGFWLQKWNIKHL